MEQKLEKLISKRNELAEDTIEYIKEYFSSNTFKKFDCDIEFEYLEDEDMLAVYLLNRKNGGCMLKLNPWAIYGYEKDDGIYTTEYKGRELMTQDIFFLDFEDEDMEEDILEFINSYI